MFVLARFPVHVILNFNALRILPVELIKINESYREQGYNRQ